MKINATHILRRGERGILLFECIVYMGLFFVLLGFAFESFYLCWDNARGFRRNADDIVRTLDVGERWRNDVRAATAGLRADNLPAGVVVHIRQQRGEINYRFSDGAVWRQGGSAADWTQVLAGVKSSRMETDKRAQVTAWRWEIELAAHRKNPNIRPLFTFEAVSPQNN